MSTKITRRGLLSLAAQAAVVVGAGKFLVSESIGQNAKADAKHRGADEALDTFVKQYMHEMNSPGMSMVRLCI